VQTSDALDVYLHVNHGQVDKARAFSASCPVRDADKIRRLDDVASQASVAYLAASTVATASEDLAEAELAALAMHADAAATTALHDLSAPSHPRKLREQALFWLGQARGAEGAQIVEHVATTDGDPELRANAVFDLSQASAVDAYASIHRIAQSDSSEHVREQALFWMAQMGDARAKDDITAAIGKDSSKHVREQGVFALSQLKDNEADAALIALIRGNYPREVKQQALFWLGQSGSTEALKFLDDVLNKQAAKSADG
jgi:HEAT repeat protein